MSEQTVNHEYDAPPKGTPRWNVPLNTNFQDLDRDVEIRDVDANKAEYEPKDGAKFLATDTGQVYVGDGANWNDLAIQGSGSYSDEDAQDAVGTILGTQFTYDDANNTISLNQGDGSGLSADLWDGRELYVQSSAPSSPNSGDIWIDTSN